MKVYPAIILAFCVFSFSSLFAEERWQSTAMTDYVQSLYAKENGALYAGGQNFNQKAQVWKSVDGEQWDSLNFDQDGSTVSSVIEFTGNVYAGTKKSPTGIPKLFKYSSTSDSGKWESVNLEKVWGIFSLLSPISVTSIFPKNEKELFVSVFGGRINLFNTTTGDWSQLGYYPLNPTCLIKSGNYFFAGAHEKNGDPQLDQGGLYSFVPKDNTWTYIWTDEDGMHPQKSMISALFVTGSVMYAGTQSYRDKPASVFRSIDSEGSGWNLLQEFQDKENKENDVLSFALLKNYLYVATKNNQVYRMSLNNDAWEEYSQGLPENSTIQALITPNPNPKSILIAGTSEGIYVLKGSTEIASSHADTEQSSFKLLQNYPNPFNTNTTITFNLSKDSWVSLKIYDVLGKVVKTIIDEHKSAGRHQVSWNGENESGEIVASGFYFGQLISKEGTKTIKMIVQK